MPARSARRQAGAAGRVVASASISSLAARHPSPRGTLSISDPEPYGQAAPASNRPTSSASLTSGPRSQRSSRPARNSRKAGESDNGNSPSHSATWTKVLPSSTRYVAYRKSSGSQLGELPIDVLDQLRVLLLGARPDSVPDHCVRHLHQLPSVNGVGLEVMPVPTPATRPNSAMNFAARRCPSVYMQEEAMRPWENQAVSEATLERARAGDEDAFRALTDPHRRELQVHCYRILGSVQDAEDMVQETLLAAWRAWPGSRAGPRCGPGSTGSRRTAA